MAGTPNTPQRSGMARFLVSGGVLYFALFGGGVYTETTLWLRVLHQALVTVLMGAWLAHLWRTKRGLPVTPLDKPLMAFVAVTFAAALLAWFPRVSLERSWASWVHVLLFYLLVDLMRRDWARTIVRALLLAGAVVVALSALELAGWYFGVPPFFEQGWLAVGGGPIPPVLHRLELVMANANLLANYMAVLIPVAVAWALSAGQQGGGPHAAIRGIGSRRAARWVLVGGLVGVLALTQSRGGWMSAGVGGAVLAGFWLWRRIGVDGRRSAGRLAWNRVRSAGRLGALTLVALIVGVLSFARLSEGRTSGDLGRLDMWRSAIEMTRDHPALGIGPAMYGTALRAYRSPEFVLTVQRLDKAHNLYLQVAAETGLVGVAVMAWLAAVFLRAWRAHWRVAERRQRLRLEACLAAFAGFGVQCMVDTFELTPMVFPLLIYAAYTVAGAPGAGDQPARPRRRWAVAVAGAAVAVAATAFAPVNAAIFNLAQSVSRVEAGDLHGALESAERAMAMDPALDIYEWQRAYVLGLLAHQEPELYLGPAIAAHEAALALHPDFDLGHANLGALYAARGNFDAAAAELERAVAIHPFEPVFWMALGLYDEAIGDMEAALAAYIRALEIRPEMAGSSFWRVPTEYLARADAVAVVMGKVSPAEALRIALLAEDLPGAQAIIAANGLLDDDIAPSAAMALGAYFLQSGDYDRASALFEQMLARDAADAKAHLGLAEACAEQEDWPAAAYNARMAMFIGSDDGSTVARASYVLARAAMHAGDWKAAERLLIAGVPAREVYQFFAAASYGPIFGQLARFDYLPQLPKAGLGLKAYAPWLTLAAYYTDTGRREDAETVYQFIALTDPYLAPAMNERLAALNE